MSMLLDEAPVVVVDETDALECYFIDCATSATWVTLWDCTCATHYCDRHLAVMEADARNNIITCEDYPGFHRIHIIAKERIR